MFRHLTAAAAAVACVVGASAISAEAAERPGAAPQPGVDRPTLFWEDRLNHWLNLSGSELYPITVDGVFDAETEAATRQFQDTYSGVPTTGVVTQLDRVALEQAIANLEGSGGLPAPPTPPAPAPPAPPAVDRASLFWEDRLNHWLNLSGSELYPITVDGVFDAETEAATRQFQDTYSGVPTTGVVTQLDRVALEQAISNLEGSGGLPA